MERNLSMTTIPVKKQNGVLLMRGATVDLCIPSFSESVFSLFIPPEIYAEMEIKNVEIATKLLSDFVTTNKIPVADYILLLQTPLFEKEFPLAPQEKLEALINLYLDYVPFDSVLSKRIKTDAGVLVIGANGDLIQAIHKMFEAVSSTIRFTAALDGITLFPKGGMSALTFQAADTALKNEAIIRQESFSLTPLRSVDSFEMTPDEEEVKEKSILPIVLPIFFILLGVLVFVYFKFR